MAEMMGCVPEASTDVIAREYLTAPVEAFTRALNGYSDAEAVTLTCAGLTAWRALVMNGAVKSGDIVFVQGTGGVSIFALQFAKAAGARFIATSSSDEKLERLKQLGADDLINYKVEPKWGEAARRLTSPADAVSIVSSKSADRARCHNRSRRPGPEDTLRSLGFSPAFPGRSRPCP